MTPYDGTGYGASIYWRSQMKDIASKNNETCPCWQYQEPKINFIDGEQLQLKVECGPICALPRNGFSVTERELVDKFKVFYKV